jgi:hypothetical protein
VTVLSGAEDAGEVGVGEDSVRVESVADRYEVVEAGVRLAQ